MPTVDPPQPQPSYTIGNSYAYYISPDSSPSYMSIPADPSWVRQYRNEAVLSKLTKTMASIIALAEHLEETPKKPLTDEERKALLEHLNNLLMSTTESFMKESQKPKAPEFPSTTETTWTAGHTHQIMTLSNPTGGISVQTHAQAQTQADQESSGEEK